MSTSINRYLQYLWLRAVHYRRIIDYIGNIEGSAHYQYIREECGEEYSRMCSTMPGSLKEEGIDMIFRNVIMRPLYIAKLFSILKNCLDPVMTVRVNNTMKGPIPRLFAKVVLAWIQKLFRDAKTRIFIILWRIKRHNNGVAIEIVKDLVKDIDFNCVVISNKFAKILIGIQSKVYQDLCRHGLRPLFVLFSNRYYVEKKDNGYIVEIPFQAILLPWRFHRYRFLLKEVVCWIANLGPQRKVCKRAIGDIRSKLVLYMYLQRIAAEILGAGKAKCLLTLSETEMDHRIFIHQAKKFNVETLLYYYTDGIHPLLYEKYYSDTIIVSNKVQFKNFVELGFSPKRCNMVGSFNFSDAISETVKARINPRYGPRNILYFTKGTRAIDEGVLDELIEKLKSLNLEYSLVIKKHPKDTNSFRRFAKKGGFVTDNADYTEFVKKSDLIISQYSGVINRVIPLRIPIILYTYSDMLEYGERAFFQNAKLPNYLRYVQNRQEFHYAIEQLLNIGEPDPLPQRLAEDLYGYLDTDCGQRIAEVMGSFVK